MKTIQSPQQSEEIRLVVKKIVQEIENSHIYSGKLSIERVVPSPVAPKNTPAGFPHLVVHLEEHKKVLGLFSSTQKSVVFIVKEGFYDLEEKWRKDMFVFLKSKPSETIIKKYLDDYGKKNQVTEIVYK